VTKALSVLLIDDNPTRAEIVEAGLAAAGYRLLARLEGTQDLTMRVRELEPDVVVVSIDSPSRDAIEDIRRSTEQQPRPIALFVDQSDPATIAAAMEAGVSAYVVKGLAQDRVRSVVDVAIGHFNRYHAMREELDRARLTLLERKTVDRAKGLLMEQRGLAEDAATSCCASSPWTRTSASARSPRTSSPMPRCSRSRLGYSTCQRREKLENQLDGIWHDSCCMAHGCPIAGCLLT
jgi:two-component system, response regulator / RNA-binding antiterminator